jgi:hypothetical protein
LRGGCVRKTRVGELDDLGAGADVPLMEVSERVQCPFCGQWFEIVIDTSTGFQRFTTDCEICCRPFEVIAECEPGEILSLEVVGE